MSTKRNPNFNEKGYDREKDPEDHYSFSELNPQQDEYPMDGGEINPNDGRDGFDGYDEEHYPGE
jgi:hypothetical protein